MAGRKGGASPSKTGPRNGNKPAKPAPRHPATTQPAPRRPAPKQPPLAAAQPAALPPRVERPRRKLPAPEGLPRAGFALLLGRPNVGKSTLLNRLVGEHLAIVSPRPQTTRNRILGIVNEPGTQLCLVDAPGVHKAHGLLNRRMVQAATTAIQDVDDVLFLAEAGWPQGMEPDDPAVDVVGPFHRSLLDEVAKANKPVLLILTKIDLLPKHVLLPVMQAWGKSFAFKEIYPLSGLTGQNTEGLIDVLRKYLPEGPPLFPSETVTDQEERTLASEFIREQVFLQTHEEVPYSVAVTIDEFDESERPLADDDSDAAATGLAAEPEAVNDAVAAEAEGVKDQSATKADVKKKGKTTLGPGLVRIEASIVVERDSHKGIIIGKGGERLKKIGTAARLHIERLLGTRVWLGLHVRVIPGWTQQKGFLSELGYVGR
jgi:GTP-binding protein Era